MRSALLAVLWLLPALGAAAAETVVHSPAWGPAGDPLAGWTSGSKVAEAREDPGLGPTLEFGAGGATSPRFAVTGAHRLRFRFSFTKTGAETPLYASVVQYRQGQRLPGFWQLWMQHPPIADSSPVELGVLTEPEADQLEFAFGVGGPEGLRVTVSRFTAVDLGPLPDYQPDGKELLEDPGWEGRTPREALSPESSYFPGPGWMGWLGASTMTVTGTPSRVHAGKQALLVQSVGSGSNAGLRHLPAWDTRADTWYDFSLWVKGEGALSLYYLVGGAYGDFHSIASPEVLASPDEWRQLHFPYCSANPAHRNLTVGVLFSGRLCLDDISVRQVTPAEAAASRDANAQWPKPDRVAQAIPAGETRTGDPVTLENAHLRVVVSPQGGGKVTEIADKDAGRTWSGVQALRLDFPQQPVPIVWGVPFAVEKSADGQTCTLKHTVTGGAAAPFLDGITIEQVFHLGAADRALQVTWRLTNTSSGTRLPNPVGACAWPAQAGVKRLSCSGERGLVAVEGQHLDVYDLTAGWAAASAPAGSLVCGFDVSAAKEAGLDPASGSLWWNYLRLSLPPGGSWQTTAWLAAVPLPEVAYADANAAVQASAAAQGEQFSLVSAVAPLAVAEPKLRLRVVNYGGGRLGEGSPGSDLRFRPGASRFTTVLEFAGARPYRAEVYNDPRANAPEAGIAGAPEVQYRPTIPARVLRLPDAGDLRAQIGRSAMALWAQGIWFQYYPLQAPLEKAGLVAETLDAGGGFPEEVEELTRYRLVVLSNLGAAQLSASARAALSQYVRGGGRLLVIGGSLALGNALTAGTDLEELLPATVSGPFEVLPRKGETQLLHPVRGSGLGGLPWQEKPRVYWAHRVQPRPNATALVVAGEEPLLLVWSCGRGRVMLFAGTVEGEPKPGEVAAWEWSGWKALWEQVVSRLLAPPA